MLDAAIDLFGRYGEEGASVRRVARAADVSLSTVMHHFGSKEGLYRACIDAVFDELGRIRDHFADGFTQSSNPRELMRDIARSALTFAFERRRLIRVSVSASIATGRTPSHIFEEVTRPTLDQVGELLSRLTGRSLPQMRLLAMTVNNVVVRYALTDPGELAQIVDPEREDVPTDVVDRATFQALEDHLTALIIGLTFP